MYWLSLFVLAFAISLDGFSVGTIYGLRKMRIPLLSIVIISACSFFMIIVSMTIGGMIEPVISPKVAGSIGGLILIVIGLGALFQYLRGRRSQPTKPQRVFQIEFKRMGWVIQIFREPSSADVDHSGIISGPEAFFLGLALSFDAFGAGISAAFLGYGVLVTACLVALMSALFLWAGKTIGYLFANVAWIRRSSFIPGVLLILLGIWKVIAA